MCVAPSVSRRGFGDRVAAYLPRTIANAAREMGVLVFIVRFDVGIMVLAT